MNDFGNCSDAKSLRAMEVAENGARPKLLVCPAQSGEKQFDHVLKFQFAIT